jgi:hypothetical protein
MSTVLARRVASTPVRTAKQTWDRIVELLAPDPASPARKDLALAAGVACASIASEATREDAIIVWGTGPRVRIYCVFDDDAITGDSVNEDPLPTTPAEGDWRMSIPCPPEDLTWSADALAVAGRFAVRATGQDVDTGETSAAAAQPVGINLTEFFKS